MLVILNLARSQGRLTLASADPEDRPERPERLDTRSHPELAVKLEGADDTAENPERTESSELVRSDEPLTKDPVRLREGAQFDGGGGGSA